MRRTKPNKEERELADSYNRGEWRSTNPSKAELRRYAAIARATLKDQRINIRLSRQDLMGIQARAVEEGLPYQTLIASLVHKYISGRLTSK